MYESFADYWASKKEILTKLGVDENTAYMIFIDAVQCVAWRFAENILKKS